MSSKDKAAASARRTAEVADQAATIAKDRCRMIKTLWKTCTGLFARSAIATFIISIFPFCFAAGLLAYTEQNKQMLVTSAGTAGTPAVTESAGFGPTHTAWREATTIIVLSTFLFTSISIFFRQQNVLSVCGKLIKWCGLALFVVASFDKEVGDSFCKTSPLQCDPATATTSPQGVMTNLYIAPWLDYTCTIIFFVGGGVISHRAMIIQEEADEAHKAAEATTSAAPYGP